MVLSCNRVLFKKDSFTLPCLLRRTYRYSQVSRITLWPTLQTVALHLKEGEKLKILQLKVVGISKESAAILWTQFATKLKHAEIENEVRERLVSGAETSKFLPRHLIASSAVSQAESEPMALILDLKEHSKSLQLNTYLRSFAKVALSAWTILWLSVSLIVATEKLTSNCAPSIRSSVFELLNWVIKAYGYPIQTILQISNSVVGQTLAAACLLTALALLSNKYLTTTRKPNLLILDETGFSQFGKSMLNNRFLGAVPWAEVKSIKMLIPQNAAGKLKNSSVKIETCGSNSNGTAIEIPLRALANEEKRKHFLNLLNSLGEGVEIDDRVLLNLEPRSEDSYTSLWLNALGKAPELATLIPLIPGQELKHGFIIEKQFSSGGQAVTYLASKAEKANAKVILKEFLLPLFIESAEQRAKERFEKDAKLLQSLEHPQIVKLQEYFTEGHRAFLVLDYIDGQNLKELVDAKGKLSEPLVYDLARQMVIILSYLHSRTPPVVHRDFTAENLILTSSGTLMLIDFDVALEIDKINEQTSMAGKTHYLPPEQFRGSPCLQSDIYAMGATLFYLLTAMDPEPLHASCPQNYSSEISDELNHFVEQCTALELNQRFKNIEVAMETLNMMKLN